MGVKSFLSAVGHKATGVLRFIGSDRGQRDLKIAEGAAVLIGTEVGGSVLGAGIAGINLLVNKGLADVFGMEATANLLGAQSGTGAQKGIAVAAGLEPLAEKLIKDLGYENPTIDQVERITSTVAKAMADIVNAVPPPAELKDVPAAGTRFAADGANAAQATLTPAPTTGMVTR